MVQGSCGSPIVPATISSLPGKLNRTPQSCACSQAQLFWGGPFNTRTGNLSTSDTDLVVSTPGLPLDWVRTYNSQATGAAEQPGALGYGGQDP
jgi:hypothetical protein